MSRLDDPPLRIREGARAVVIDDDGHVLLVRWQFAEFSVWGTPGGGIEADEAVDVALRRELSEELGLEQCAIGVQVWERTHIVPFVSGLWDGQHDAFFLVRHDHFTPTPRLSPDELRAEHLVEIRWWSPEQLADFVPTATEFFAPRRLPELVRQLLDDGAPPDPIDTGV